jgi:hypothetical protein
MVFDDRSKLKGTIEVDEVLLGGKKSAKEVEELKAKV